MKAKITKFIENNEDTIKSVSLAGLGIAGLLCLTSKNKTTKGIGVGLLGITAIGALSSFTTNKSLSLSKNKVILFGGVDLSNEGEYGTNREIGRIVATAAQEKGVPLNNGDVTIFNSPLTVNDFKMDIVNPLINTINRNFDKKNGKIILYGYSLGGNVLMYCLDELKKANINIDLLITIDSAKGYFGKFAVKTEVPDNVKCNLNIFQSEGSKIGSYGYANNGTNVINVDLTGLTTFKGEPIQHGNIDDYTMLFVSQLILYYLQDNKILNKMSIEEIKNKIHLFDSQR